MSDLRSIIVKNMRRISWIILALTANAFKEDCDKAAEMGMNGHVAKPLDAAKLFQAIAKALKTPPRP